MFDAYLADAKAGEVIPGRMHVWPNPSAPRAMSRFSEAVVFEGDCSLAADLDPNELAVCLLDDEGRTRTPTGCRRSARKEIGRCDRDEPARDEDFKLVALESELLIYSVVSIAPPKTEFFLLDLREDSGGSVPGAW